MYSFDKIMECRLSVSLSLSLLSSACLCGLAASESLVVNDVLDFVETPAGLEIISLTDDEILLRIQVIPGKRYLFGFSSSLNDAEWNISGMSLSVTDSASIEEFQGLYRFVPMAA